METEVMITLLLSLFQSPTIPHPGTLKSLEYTQSLPGCESKAQLTLDHPESKEFISINGLVVIKPTQETYLLSESQLKTAQALQGKKILIESKSNLSLCSLSDVVTSIKPME